MHPGFIHWWQSKQHADCSPRSRAGCGPGHLGGADFGRREHGHAPGGGFGVRRPVRFLAWKLELEEEQTTRLATIIEHLKTERAQADLDLRRSTSAIADALEHDTLQPSALDTAAKQRVDSEERLQAAVQKALTEIHQLLDAEQRKRFSFLIRTGVIQL